MSLSRLHIWNVGEVLGAADLNAEFNNILNFINSSPIIATDSLTLAENDILTWKSGAWANTSAAPKTWTPTDGSGASLTFTSVSAGYFKIGTLVTVFGRVTYPSTANGAGAVIAGLPFPVADTAQAACAIGTVNSDAVFGVGSLALLPTQNDSNAGIWPMNGTGAGQVINSAISTHTLKFIMTYPAAS